MRHNYRYAHTVHEHARLCSTIVGNKKYAPIALAIPACRYVCMNKPLTSVSVFDCNGVQGLLDLYAAW